MSESPRERTHRHLMILADKAKDQSELDMNVPANVVAFDDTLREMKAAWKQLRRS